MKLPAPGQPLVSIVSPRLLREITSLSKSSLQRLQRTGDLPPPIRLTPRRVGWPRDVIEAWLTARMSR